VPFAGPQSKRAESAVQGALKKRAELVPGKRWSVATKTLAKRGITEDPVAVADAVGADWVVIGAVRKDGGRFQLVVTLRDGKSGNVADRLTYPLKGPRVEPRTMSQLAVEIGRAFDAAVARGGGGKTKTAPPPVTDDDTPPPVAKNKKPPPPVIGDDDEKPGGGRNEPPPAAATVEAEDADVKAVEAERAEAKRRAKATQTPDRPRWAPYFDLWAAGTISSRNFTQQPPNNTFSGKPVGGIRIDATIYPFAFSWRTAGGVFATMGFGATLDVPVWGPSTAPDGNKYATSELRVDGGLRWRFVLYKPIPRPELTLFLGGGLHSFSIAKKMDPVTGNLVDVGPPDVAYSQLTVGVGVRLHFAEWASVHADFRYNQPFDAGEVTTTTAYGPASVYGVRFEGGLDFFVYKGLKLGAIGYYERYSFSFDPSFMPPPGQMLFTSAVDEYFGGMILLGYVF
jgi:hypothetical protein